MNQIQWSNKYFTIAEIFLQDESIKERLTRIYNSRNLIMDNVDLAGTNNPIVEFYELVKLMYVQNISIFKRENEFVNEFQLKSFTFYLINAYENFYTNMMVYKSFNIENFFKDFLEAKSKANANINLENKNFKVNAIEEKDMMVNESIYITDRSTNKNTTSSDATNSLSLAQILPATYPLINSISNFMTNAISNLIATITLPIQNIEEDCIPWVMKY